MVYREPDNLDSGKPGFNLDQKPGIGAVEPVNGLRRVADEEQIIAALAEDVNQLMLKRVEVLSLVDQ